MSSTKIRTITVSVIFLAVLTVKVRADDCIAQVGCAIYSLYYALCIPRLPATAYDCATDGPFSAVCRVKTNACHPHPECTSCDKAAHPIDLANGNTYITQIDLNIPGAGGGLSLERTWNSVWPATESPYRQGLFGPNWRSTFEERVIIGSDGYVKYSRADGSFWSFGYTGQTDDLNFFGINSPANQNVMLTQDIDTWTVAFQNGEKRVFDRTSGYLLSKVDRHGNTTQLAYDPSFRLVTITDPAARHLYFSYASPTSYLVSAVTSDVGIALSYSYDTEGRLSQITKPDNTTVSFQYDSHSHITAVLDSEGKVLESHTYDSQGRGLTSSRAGGVDAVTISYPQPPPPILSQ